MEVTIIIGLHQNTPTGKEGHISHDGKRVTDVGEVKHRGSLELLEEDVEGGLLLGIPMPGLACSH